MARAAASHLLELTAACSVWKQSQRFVLRPVFMLLGVDLGQPISYQVLGRGVPVYSADGQAIGKVAHVLAAEDEDVFDGIVVGEHVFGHDHRFADADDVDEIYEHGVVLKLDRPGCEQLPKPSANPAVMRDDPADSKGDFRRGRLRRAWDLISGND